MTLFLTLIILDFTNTELKKLNCFITHCWFDGNRNTNFFHRKQFDIALGNHVLHMQSTD